ncbi:MAG: 3-coathanger stack domain-containing protein [Spirosomataceae bacterium]
MRVTSYGVNGVATPTWQWQVNNGGTWTNLTNNATYADVTAETLNILSVPSAPSGIQYRVIGTVGASSATSGPGTITTVTANGGSTTGTITWTGLYNTDWNNACNWSPMYVPTAANDVVLSGGTYRYAAIPTISSNVTVNSLSVQMPFTINTGATLTINGDITGTFYGIHGNIVINGTLQANGTSNRIEGETGLSMMTIGTCGKMIVPNGDFQCVIPTTNNGYLQSKNLTITSSPIPGNSSVGGTFTNNGIIKSSNVPNATNATGSITVNDIVTVNKSPIFNISGTFSGTINGIFTNAAASTSAGTYNSGTNSLTPISGLPSGLQTLYAKITTSTGCVVIIPFEYNNFSALTQLWSDTFEDTGAPSSGTRTPSIEYGSGSTPYSAYFRRTNGTDINLYFVNFNSFQGSKYWAGINMDKNAAGTENAQDALQNITYTNINITGKVDLRFVGRFSSSPHAVYESMTHTTGGDYMEMEYSIDGGAYNKIIGIYSTVSGENTGSLKLDTNGDLIGDGTAISNVFPEIIANIPGSGSTLSLRLKARSNDFELMGVDNFRLFGSNGCTQVATATETMTWNGSVSSDWNNPCNWTPNGVPTATNIVNINDVTNDPLVQSGTTAVCKNILLNPSSTLTINTGGTLTVNEPSPTSSGINGIFVYSSASLINNGTLNITSGSSNIMLNSANANFTNSGTTNLSSGFKSIVLNGSNQSFTNTGIINFSGNYSQAILFFGGSSGYTVTNSGTMNVNGSGGNGAYFLEQSNTSIFTNSGTINVNSGLGIIMGGGTFTNQNCGKLFLSSGTFNNSTSGSSVSNSGVIAIAGTLNNTSGSFTNNSGGVLKYGSLTGTVTNSNGSVIVNNNPTNSTIFSYTGTFTGTINGIYTNATATTSAGTFTAPNTFAPSGSLPAGSQTLYAKITPSGGACDYVVPFTYVNCTATASIYYTGSPFCKTASPVSVTQTGTSGGTFTSSPTGLSLSGAGQITPSTSTAGTYTVSYTIAASGGCAAVTATTSVTITNNPTASISYTGSPFCKTASPVSVTQTGTAGGTFTSSPAGLSLSSAGQITPSTSTAGTYTVTYTIAASGGCAAVIATTSVTINDTPTVSISYPAAAICKSAGTTDITRNGTPSSGGTFSSSPSGLTLNSSTGRVTPSSSTANTYTVTLTIPASGGCPVYTATTALTITAEPSATIGYAASGYCTTAGVQNVIRTGTAGGTYAASPSGLSIDTNTGQITPSTSTPGNYTVIYTIPATGGCSQFQTSDIVSISSPANATIAYSASGFCSTDGAKSVNRSGTAGGTFSSSPAGLSINSSSGLITPSSSSAGTYTVTYSIAATNGCPAFTTTTSVAISTPPSATISYTGSPFCGVSTPINVSRTGTTGGTFSSSPAGLSINPSTGQITPNTSTAGTYTVTYSVSSNCPLFTTTASVALSSQPSVPTNVSTSSNLLCGGASVTLSATCASGTVTWYNQATGGTYIGTGQSLVQTPTATTTYYVNCNNGICESNRIATNPVVIERDNGGISTPYTNSSFVTQNNLYYNKITLTKGIRADSVKVLVLDGGLGIQGNARIKFAIYSDLNGEPNTLLASSDGNAAENAPFLVAGINKFRLNTPTYLSCGTYWVSYVLSSPESIAANFQNGDPVPDSDTKYSPFTFGNAFPTVNNLTKSTNGFAYNVYFSGAADCQIVAPTVNQNVNVCSGSSATLTATCTSGTVTWYTSATASTGTANSPLITPIINANTSYYVACVSGNCASARTQVNLTVTAPPNAQISGSDNLSCAITSVTRTASGGNSYLWSNGLGTNAIATITSAGTYTVTVTGANGCTATATTTVIIDNTAPNAQITGSNNLSCAVTSVTRTASGGSSYLWSNGLGTNATATITSAGTYTVTVTGVNGCTATATTTVTIDNTAPNAQITGSNNLSCAVTSVTRTASGGSSYLWSNGLGTNAIATITSAGTYTVTVTGANGCTATATTTVTNDGSLPNAQITGSDNLSCSVTSVTRTASGGNSYLWSNNLGTNATATITSAGTYTVTVTGDNGCTATATTTVTNDGSLPNAQITGSDNLSCAVTSVTRTASGGSSYLWSNSLGTNATATITSAGTYTVTVTGTNGCTATATTTVTNDGSLPNAQITGSNNLSCSVTSVTRTASGGSSYLWSNGLGTNATATITSAGTYTVTVTGVNGCTATATTTVTNDGSLPNAQITGSDNLSCSVTSVTRTASGGNSYLWSNNLGTNATATITSAGTYTVTVTGANGCTATATTTVTIDNTAPNAQIAGSTNLSCAVTSVTRTASGGSSYLWSNGLGTNATATITSAGTYTVTVTGANGCTATATTTVTNDGSLPNAQITGSNNLSCSVTSVTRTASGGSSYLWSNGLGTNATATITSVGTYTVTVTGGNGCTATATTTVTNDGSLPNAQITGSTNLSCSVTSVTRTASGGNSYLWSNNLGTNATATITSAGTYTVTVTGANGCTATATTSVTSSNNLTVTASNSGPYQVGNTIELSASGATSYFWTGPNGFTSTVQNPTIAATLVINQGIYTVTGTSGGCSASATTNVIVNSGIDPCAIGIDYQFVKSGNPYQPLFSLTNGMSINQINEEVSIIAVPICPTLNIESVRMEFQGASNNINITQSVSPYALFDNTANNVFGRILTPGVYSLTVTGYSQDNLQGNVIYGPTTITFTILPNVASINAPTVSTPTLCSGSSFTVNFAAEGTFNPTNQFKVELSDANGNFGSTAIIGNSQNAANFVYPTIIGTSNSTGAVTCTIPSNIEGGNNYRIRVISNEGVSVSPINANAITIHPKDLTLVSPTDDYSTNAGTKQASQKITASNKINASGIVNYQAGKAIILNAGFEANAGTVFEAKINGCNN